MTRSMLLLFPAFFLGACDDGTDKTTDTSGDSGDTDTDTDTGSGTDSADDSAIDTAAVMGSISITSPGEGAVMYPGVSVTWEVSDFILDAENVGGTSEEGHGHVHVYIDNEYKYATADSGITLSEADLGAGTHTVEVRLAENDHTELRDAGATESTALVNVEVLSPSVAISEPVDGSTATSAGIYIGYSVSDFAVVDEIDGTNGVGRGHVHLMLDGLYYDLSTSPTGGWFLHLASGEHTLGVMLVNNDHTELGAGTPMASVTVTVPATAPDINLTSALTADWNSATIPVEVETPNFVLSEDVDGAPVEGEGHYHIYVDGVYADIGTSASTYLSHVAAGEHELEVRLADNMHAEYGARDSMSFSVAANRPDVTITSPLDGESVTSDTSVLFTPENFVLDPTAVGSASNVEGTGHVHLYIDGAYYNYDADGVMDVMGLASGDHTLRIELVNNDHSYLSPAVYDETTVSVP